MSDATDSDREEIIRILDIEGAQTGECGHEPGELADCTRGCRELLEEYADALITAGFSRGQSAPQIDREALTVQSDRDFIAEAKQLAGYLEATGNAQFTMREVVPKQLRRLTDALSARLPRVVELERWKAAAEVVLEHVRVGELSAIDAVNIAARSGEESK